MRTQRKARRKKVKTKRKARRKVTPRKARKKKVRTPRKTKNKKEPDHQLLNNQKGDVLFTMFYLGSGETLKVAVGGGCSHRSYFSRAVWDWELAPPPPPPTPVDRTLMFSLLIFDHTGMVLQEGD